MILTREYTTISTPLVSNGSRVAVIGSVRRTVVCQRFSRKFS